MHICPKINENLKAFNVLEREAFNCKKLQLHYLKHKN